MAKLRMSQLATTDAKRSGAFQHAQALRKPVSMRSTSSESARVGASVRVLRVLIVDAEQDAADALLWQVRYAGHGAHAAPNGLAALRVAAAWRPDIVLLDMEMPSLDGCQFAKHLRSDCLNENCLIIAFTESIDDARRKSCIETGVDLLLHKPVDRDVVETLLMLEYVHVNRRRINKLNRLTSPDRRPTYMWSKPC